MIIKDREARHINRKKLKIIENIDDVMIVDVEQADEGVIEGGTALNADFFNGILNTIDEMQENVNNSGGKIEELLQSPDCSDIDAGGAPSVEIVNGKFKFNNLKGESGVALESPGRYYFYVNANGELCVKTVEFDAANFKLENGILKYIIE